MKNKNLKNETEMEVTDGSLSWSATLDISGISKAKDTLVKYFKDMGLSAEEAGKRADAAMETIEGIIQEATKDVKSQAEAVGVLKDAYEEIQEQLEGMEESTAKEVLQGVGEGIHEIVTEMEAMSEEDIPLDKLGQEAVSARQQLREMTEELVNMKMRGEENTEEYQQLLEKVGMLKDAMMDTQQAVKGMASDTATLDSVLGAAQLTAGGFSAIIGAMNLVGAGEDTKELAEAQKKLQAAIAVTTGLQSVQNALQKQSAVMLGIQKIQTLAAAKAEDIKTAATGRGVVATKAATVAQKAFNAVAKANPYVLLAMAVLTVVGALAAFTSGAKENERQQKSLNDELERQLDILNKLNGVYNTQQSNEINKLRNILDLLKAQGASIEAIRDAEDQLDNAEKARIDREKEDFKDLLDHADEYETKLEDLRKKAQEENKNGNEAKKVAFPSYDQLSDYSTWEVPFNHPNYIADRSDAMVDFTVEELESVEKIVDKIHQIQQDDENFQNKMRIKEENRLAEDKERRDKAAKEASERRKRNLEEEKKYQEELRQARERAEDLELGNGSDNINTRVAKVELDYSRQITEAQKKADEARANKKIELAEEYERQVSALLKKREAEINNLYAAEEEAQAQAVEEVYDNYKGYDARRRAIEQRYSKEIETLTKKRDEFEERTEEWEEYNQAVITATQQQQAEFDELEIEYGELNRLAAKREELERKILVVANKIKKAETEEEKNALSNELSNLKSELKEVNDEIEEMNKQLSETKEWLGEIEATDIVDIAHDMADAFTEMSGASKETAEGVGIIADGISSIAQGYSSGGLAGAIISAIGWAIDGMKTLAEQTAKENTELAEFQAQLDKIHQSLHVGDFDTIFGNDAIGRIQALARAYKRLVDEAIQFIRFYTSNAVDNIFDFQYYRIAGLYNQNLDELAREFGMNLFDEGGGYNTEFLQMILDQYGDRLSDDEKKLLQSLMNYSSAFQSATEQVASYLESLFGEVADTIADQFVDSFLESGQAAMDFGKVVSDVARQMAKDFIKNMLYENVFNTLSSDFEAVMLNNNLTQQQKQEQLMALLAIAQGEIDALQPEIQAYLEAMQRFFGESDAMTEEALSGNLLQSASQDSIDLVNGQMNAIRNNQSIAISRLDEVLFQLMGLRNDMNDGFEQSNRHLEQISDNTSEHGSILRAFGLG